MHQVGIVVVAMGAYMIHGDVGAETWLSVVPKRDTTAGEFAADDPYDTVSC